MDQGVSGKKKIQLFMYIQRILYILLVSSRSKHFWDTLRDKGGSEH